LLSNRSEMDLSKNIPCMSHNMSTKNENLLNQRFTTLLAESKERWDKKNFAMGSFLDIKGAFDNTSFLAMNGVCGGHGVNPTSTRWIAALFGQRTVTAIIRGESITIKVRKGCPQGGVLSPLLWNIVFDELIRRLNSTGLWSQGFAGDISKFLSSVSELMQNALNIV
jgi:Reverse transcriptase (RNA-dependent DNA polymerase)